MNMIGVVGGREVEGRGEAVGGRGLRVGNRRREERVVGGEEAVGGRGDRWDWWCEGVRVGRGGGRRKGGVRLRERSLPTYCFPLPGRLECNDSAIIAG